MGLQGESEKEDFFFEKKKQKTFALMLSASCALPVT
jgi:hypothetical protein